MTWIGPILRQEEKRALELRLRERSVVYVVRNTVNVRRFVGSTTCIRSRMYSLLGALRRSKVCPRLMLEDFKLFKQAAFIVEELSRCDLRSAKLLERDFIERMRPEYNVNLKLKGLYKEARS